MRLVRERIGEFCERRAQRSDANQLNDIEYNAETQTLFLQLHQIFHLFFVPFFAPTVNLTTILHLTPSTPRVSGCHSTGSSEGRRRTKYLIKHQEDLYQSTEIVKFFWPGGTKIIGFWRLVATVLCILGAMVFAPMTWMEEWGWFGNGKDAREKERENGAIGDGNENGAYNSRRDRSRSVNGVGRKDK